MKHFSTPPLHLKKTLTTTPFGKNVMELQEGLPNGESLHVVIKPVPKYKDVRVCNYSMYFSAVMLTLAESWIFPSLIDKQQLL